MSKRLILIIIVGCLSATASFALFGKPTDSDTSAFKSWIAIHTPVNDTFRNAFLSRTADKGNAWATELSEHYRTDGKLVFRGVCEDASRTLEDFLHMFVSVSDDMVSQRIAHVRQKPPDADKHFNLQRAIFADFSRYNRDAYQYALYAETAIHQIGPVAGNESAYAQSYGFSTSWSFWVAADFAGVKPGTTPCTNAMVFGMYPANYFVDYANLEAVDARFKRLYPDEKEILGVGAVDPDSLMMAVRLEARGESRPVVTEVVIRDPLNPTQVNYFDGEVDSIVEDVKVGWELERADFSRMDATLREHRVRPPTPLTVPPDSTFRLPLGRSPVVRSNGVERKPTKVIALDYGRALFPNP